MKIPADKSSIMRLFSRPYVYAAVFTFLLTAAFVFTLLDAFVIPKALQLVPQIGPESKTAQVVTAVSYKDENDEPLPPSVSEQPPETDNGVFLPDMTEDIIEEYIEPESKTVAVVTAVSYKDENIEIFIEKIRVYDTDVYIADIKIGSIDYLKSAFARNTYGRNINEKTSVIAERKAAIFAINGDFYGFRNNGWVLRNGVLYRTGRNDIALLMDMAGNLSIDGNRASIAKRARELRQIWSFGPPLVVNGAVSVSENQEISGRSSNSNPRTAIGQAGELHYIFIVSDGRTAASAGLSLYKLASLFRERGCVVAYNLDGGGSAAMYFNGRIVNRPTTDGKKIIEREVSDIVYIGY